MRHSVSSLMKLMQLTNRIDHVSELQPSRSELLVSIGPDLASFATLENTLLATEPVVDNAAHTVTWRFPRYPHDLKLVAESFILFAANNLDFRYRNIEAIPLVLEQDDAGEWFAQIASTQQVVERLDDLGLPTRGLLAIYGQGYVPLPQV